MKAKVIKTGEIVDVTAYQTWYEYPTWYETNKQVPYRREWNEEELDFSVNSEAAKSKYMINVKQNPIMIINDNEGIEPLKIKDAPKVKKMTPAEFIKYAADNHIKFDIPEDNRKYPGQQCQDDLINQKFRTLHKQIVNAIIQFCKENDILIDEFHLNADALKDSIKVGSWQSCTDSCLTFDKFNKSMVEFAEDIDKAWDAYYDYRHNLFGGPGNGCDDYRDIDLDKESYLINLYKKARNMEEGFNNMYDITYREYKESIKDIKDPKEPYLFSM